MCAGLLAQTPEEPKEPKPALSLDQEFSINATIYSARAWLSNDETFPQTIWKGSRFASASHAGKSILPIGTVKILNLSDDNLKIVVPPHSEGVLTSNGLSDVQASTSGGASKVTFLFHIFFSRDPGSDKKP
ncbi:TPA: hypothetical protein QCY18_002389 [Bacillus cereus]|uniref:hypothetical protein n=1 Tax=Bacillus cereus TaxID=1396 RepID=UPI0011AA96F1|nr:hypothetical protein [Bacillus cereus]HDR7809944.1 hypothetical protein [Bacillus cereus]HDX9495728.1 hypothetical protein [Bacillus thuringiensis]HDX9565339.1 hypothetical protein [Bacillus thuringiensis]